MGNLDFWRMTRRFFFCLFISFSPLSAALVGNPAEPDLFAKGIIFGRSWLSFRAGYFDDWVYKQRFHDEFEWEGAERSQTNMKLSTYAALLTFNFKNRFDLYGIVGSSRMQIDQEVFTKRALGWGVGGKLILLKFGNLFFGADAKYFETNQKPKYFIIDGPPYNIVGNYRLKYQEWQAALGIAYKIWIFSPYLNGTYLSTSIDPQPSKLLIRFPDVNELGDLDLEPSVGKKRWGLATGLSLIDCEKASLSFEWRVFNQNAINVNMEIRF